MTMASVTPLTSTSGACTPLTPLEEPKDPETRCCNRGKSSCHVFVSVTRTAAGIQQIHRTLHTHVTLNVANVNDGQSHRQHQATMHIVKIQ